MRSLLLVPIVAWSVAAGCNEPASTGVTGPFTGEVHRYVVDRFDLPLNNAAARATGDDLNGDTTVDNQTGQLFGTLATEMNLTTHAADMIAAGVLQTAIEIQADDFTSDATVGVRYVGAPATPFTVLGGSLADGVFVSNRTADADHLGAATLVLPVFADADPTSIHAVAMELSFTPAADGGLDVRIAGGFDGAEARAAIAEGIQTMVASNPQDHVLMADLFDENGDHHISASEVSDNNLVLSLLAPDIIVDGVDLLSFGFQLHAVPCETGSCGGTIADTCHDRALDGDETDLDCGGSCGACASAASCAVPADCQSGTCANGTCTAPTCSDGLQNGFESAVDCGFGCTGCGLGETCRYFFDCASQSCTNGRCTAS
jgi:hypothetical protein